MRSTTSSAPYGEAVRNVTRKEDGIFVPSPGEQKQRRMDYNENRRKTKKKEKNRKRRKLAKAAQ